MRAFTNQIIYKDTSILDFALLSQHRLGRLISQVLEKGIEQVAEFDAT